MLTAILWPDDSYLAVDLIQLDANRLHVTTHGTQTSAQCPSCQAESTRVNGYSSTKPALTSSRRSNHLNGYSKTSALASRPGGGQPAISIWRMKAGCTRSIRRR